MAVTQDKPESRKATFKLRLQRISRISWRDLAGSLGLVLLLSAAAIAVAFHFVRPAPPDTLTIASGPEGSTFHSAAERYQKILARSGVKLMILPSHGSLDNLNRLTDPNGSVDIGFVQAGVTGAGDTGDLVSLGSVFYQPLTVFYRSRKPIHRLSELLGKRIAVGSEGSGTRFLALALLKANGIDGRSPTQLLALEGEAARSALVADQADAIFLSGDSAGPATVREMLHTKGVRLYGFPQADAYQRRFRYLSKLVLPAGAFDLGENLPREPLTMLAPTVELVARSELHPALSDLLIDAAREVHGKASLLQDAGEFPTPLKHEFPISDDAARYYKSGKSIVYRLLPFWLASLVNRAFVVLVPVIVVLIPGLRLVPALYRWRVNSRIYRRYGELMALERAALEDMSPEQRAALLDRLGDIEKSVITGKIPGAYADQLYILRQHIKFVRDRLVPAAGAPRA
ncbi:MAG: ABC transporter substrate-binding protein [Nevskia sp.]|nr:ABC transporter substrate-binding protein [Nevskia sp.]